MKRTLLASASVLCALWAGLGAAQFNPNAPTSPNAPAPSKPSGNLGPSQPGLLVPQPGNTNIGIPSQNIPGASLPLRNSSSPPAPKSSGTGAKKNLLPGKREAAKPDTKRTSGAAAAANKTAKIASPGAGSMPPLTARDRAVLENLRGRIGAIGEAEEVAHLRDILDGVLKGDDPLAKAQAGALAGSPLAGAGRKTADPKGGIGERFARPLEPKSSSGDRWEPPSPETGEKMPAGPRYGQSNPSDRHKVGVFGYGPGAARGGSGVKNPSGKVGYDYWVQTGEERERRGSGYVVRTEYWRSNDRTATSTTNEYRYDNGGLAREEIIRHSDGTAEVIRVKWSAEGKEVAFVHLINGRPAGEDPNGGVQTAIAGAQREIQRTKSKQVDQPVAEGTGRTSGGGYQAIARFRGGRQVICDFFGCRETAPAAGTIGDPGREGPDGSRATPATVDSGRGTRPGDATDPRPDDIGGSSGGGARIRGPSDGPESGPKGPGAPPQ